MARRPRPRRSRSSRRRCNLADADLDYALVAVRPAATDGRPLSYFGWNPLLQEEGKAIAAQWVNIIQHSEGGMKALALRENRIVDILEQYYHYLTDTAPGSSGSPMFNDRWEVIGLHHSGIWAEDADGRILAVDGRPWTADMGEDRIRWIANEGIRISRILADLRKQPAGEAQTPLLAELFSPPPPYRTPSRIPEVVTSTGTPESSGATVRMAGDGTATWTIPLTVSVRLGDVPAPASTAAGTTGRTPPRAATSQPTPRAAPPADGDGESPEAKLAAARTELGSRPDVLGVRLGYLFRDGWITRERAIVVTARRRKTVAELREAGVSLLPQRFRGLPVDVTNPTFEDLITMAQPAQPREAMSARARLGEEIVYQPPAGVPLDRVEDEMRVCAHVSPDHGWPVLRDFLAGTQRRLVVGMYDFGAQHILAALEAARTKGAFERLSLVMQHGSSRGRGTKENDLADEDAVRQLQDALGGKFENAWVRLGSVRGWVTSAYHIKVAVRDSRSFWLSSGNWQSSNQPDADPLNETPQTREWLTKYNREWHAIVEHAGLARTFEAYLTQDFEHNRGTRPEEIAAFDVLVPALVSAPAPEERAAPFRYFAPFDETRRFVVQPVLTPDNFLTHTLELVRGAKRSLLIQNQTFNAPRQDQAELNDLIRAVLAKQQAGLDVRIIFRVVDQAKARENLEALIDFGFDPRSIKVHNTCHTKGVVVDGERVMLGSQNWSSEGITVNRDASLLFFDAPLARYFAQIFEHDWQNVARQNIGSEARAPELAAAADTTPEGMTRLSLKDVREMS